MPRIHFHQQLEQLKDKLLAMAALSQQAVEYAVDAYLERDERLVTFVRENEAAINMAQRDVDEMAYELLAKEQPMAIDLRFILSVIKINADLERIGDQSMSIARRAEDMLRVPAATLPVDIAAMGTHATDMIRRAVQALIEADAPLAESVREMDDDIDHMNRTAHVDLIQVMQQSPDASLQALNASLPRATWSASPTTPPTSRPTSSSGCAAPMSASARPGGVEESLQPPSRSLHLRSQSFIDPLAERTCPHEPLPVACSFLFSPSLCCPPAGAQQAPPRPKPSAAIPAHNIAIHFDPQSTQIHFKVGSLLRDVRGTFQFKGGALAIDPDSTLAQGELLVDATTGHTGNAARDKEMQEEVLESKRYPSIFFHAEHLRGQVPKQMALQT